MKLINKLLAYSILVFPIVANATQDTGHVGNIFVFSKTYGFTMREGFTNAKAEFNCNSNFARIPSVDKGNTNSKEMYSAILAAMAANKKVRINIDGCFGSHFKVSGIYVEHK